MKVTSGYNPYAYQQQKAPSKGTGFADMLVNQMKTAGSTGTSSSSSAMSQTEAQRTEKLLNFVKDTAIRDASMENRPNAENYPATLTQEQIDALKSKYDFKNMEWPSYESAALGEELFDLGVIDNDARKFFYGAVKYTKERFTPGLCVPAGEETGIREYEHKPGQSMIDMLLGELAAQRENLDFVKSYYSADKGRYMADDKESREKHIASLEEYMSQFQDIFDILQQFI